MTDTSQPTAVHICNGKMHLVPAAALCIICPRSHILVSYSQQQVPASHRWRSPRR